MPFFHVMLLFIFHSNVLVTKLHQSKIETKINRLKKISEKKEESVISSGSRSHEK